MCTTTKAGSCLHGCPLIPVQLCTPQHHWWSGLSLHILFFRGQITLQSQESYVSGKFLAFCLGGRGRAAEGGEESCCLWGFPVDGEAGRLWLCFSLLSRPSLYIVQSYLSDNITLGEWDHSFFFFGSFLCCMYTSSEKQVILDCSGSLGWNGCHVAAAQKET